MNKVFLTGNLTRDPEVSISLRVETRLRTLEWRSTNAGQIPEVVNRCLKLTNLPLCRSNCI